MTYSSSSFEVFDAGTYPARVFRIEDDDEGQFGPQYKFIWQLLNPETNAPTDHELHSWCSKKLTSKSKLAMWAATLLGIPQFDNGAVLDVDELVGKTAMLTVTVEPRRDGDGERNKVVAVTPYRRSAAAPAPAATSTGSGRTSPF